MLWQLQMMSRIQDLDHVDWVCTESSRCSNDFIQHLGLILPGLRNLDFRSAASISHSCGPRLRIPSSSVSLYQKQIASFAGDTKRRSRFQWLLILPSADLGLSRQARSPLGLMASRHIQRYLSSPSLSAWIRDHFEKIKQYF